MHQSTKKKKNDLCGQYKKSIKIQYKEVMCLLLKQYI